MTGPREVPNVSKTLADFKKAKTGHRALYESFQNLVPGP